MPHRDGPDDRENQAARVEPTDRVSSPPASDADPVQPVPRTGSDVHTRPDTPIERSKRPASRPASTRSSNAPAGDPRVGETLVGRYRLGELIGKGGMGRVYVATQFPLNRSVAVKILNPEFQQKDAQFVRRFFLEAATAARLNHPNTITIFDYGETDRGELFIAMEYLKGRSLSRAISGDGPMSAERTLHISMQIARALREAHGKGIIHRDLKPGNIMLLEEGDDANFAKVLDFGLVKLFNPAAMEGGEPAVVEQLTPSPLDGEMTRAGMFLGSPKYMSPEQIRGLDLDPRTDVYSLGIIMFQMLVGRVPFRGGTSVEILYKHINHPVPAIHDMNPEADAPPELERAIERCLRKNRDERIPSMAALLNELKQVRRAITGSSSFASSVGSLDIVMSEVSESYPPQTPLPLRSSVPTPLPFQEPDVVPDDTAARVGAPSAPAPRDPTFRSQSATRRLFPYLLGGLILLALGILAYSLTSKQQQQAEVVLPLVPAPDPRPPEPAPPSDPEPRSSTHVTFESRPPGAEVFEGETLLGTTPFERELELGDAMEVRKFVFRKTGYRDEELEQTLDGDRVRISTSLEQEERQEPRRSSRRTRGSGSRQEKRGTKPPTEYKENPY